MHRSGQNVIAAKSAMETSREVLAKSIRLGEFIKDREHLNLISISSAQLR